MSKASTLTELAKLIGDILPEATFGEDNEGQLVIYTNLAVMADDTLAVMPDEEEQDDD